MAGQQLPAFTKFIHDLRAVWQELPDDESRMKKAWDLMETLLADDDLKAVSKTWPSTESRKNLLFYEDPDFGFAINGVVRVPGRKGSIHDHDRAWVLYGLLVGNETLERYDRLDDGSKEGYAELTLSSAPVGGPGSVDLVPPFDIHAEQGGATRSVAIILRSTRVAGRILQGGYNMKAKTYFKQDGPEQIPYELTD